jgi:hypothetical protein
MLLVAIGVYALSVGFGGMTQPTGGGDGTGCDTVQAGDATISLRHLQSFTVTRHLILTRGHSVMPFGTQTETLTSSRLNGRPTLLDVLVFDTPRGKTVDSSWVDGRTFQPLRFQSNNAARAITLDFEGKRLRGRTVPSTGAPTEVDQHLVVRPFEWNILGLAIGGLPLRTGYCAQLPVYSDRFGKVIWYTVEVLRDTTVARKSRPAEAVWEVVARGEEPAPSARYWVSRHHRVVSRVLVWEPGISIMYARD